MLHVIFSVLKFFVDHSAYVEKLGTKSSQCVYKGAGGTFGALGFVPPLVESAPLSRAVCFFLAPGFAILTFSGFGSGAAPAFSIYASPAGKKLGSYRKGSVTY